MNTIDGNSVGGFVIRAPSFDDADFDLNAIPRVQSTGGSSSQRTVDDSTFVDSVSANVLTESDVIASEHVIGTFDTGVALSSLTPSIATVNHLGRVTRVSNGTAAILAQTYQVSRVVSVPISLLTPTAATVFANFVSGSLARHCADAIDTRIALRSGRVIHDGAAYQTACWARDVNLTGMTLDTPRGTLISPRHLIGVEHYQPGSTARFLTAAGAIVSRTIVSRTNVGPSNASDGYSTDIVVCKLDSDVPAGVTFFRMLPANLAAYLPGYANGVPVLSTDQDERANVGEIFGIGSGGVQIRPSPVPARAAFGESIVGGDSGCPSFLIVNGAAVLLTQWTFGGAVGVGVDLSTERTLIDAAMTTLGGGYVTATVDLSTFPTY